MKTFIPFSLFALLVGACVTTWSLIEHSIRVAFLAGLGTFFCTLCALVIFHWLDVGGIEDDD